MPNIQFLSAENEIQKIYSQLGLVVPVGDLSTGKAPAVQPLSTSSTQTSVTASFNVMTGADLTAMSYTVNDGEAQSITPSKGVVTVTLTDLEYNSGPYTIKLTATNETGSTNVTSTVALQHYTNWATPDEVLEGNKYIGEDGEEHVGEIETKDSTDLTISGLDVTIPAGYYAESITATSQGVIPSGTLPITQNGEGIDVTNYAAVDVAVPTSAANNGSWFNYDQREDETDDPNLDGVTIYQVNGQEVTQSEWEDEIDGADLATMWSSASYALQQLQNMGFDGIGSITIGEKVTYYLPL